MAQAPGEEQALGFDEILTRLEGVVTKLEQKELPLEDALATFEQGIVLARDGERILAQAERRVELLLGARDGEIITEPFASAPAGEEPRDR